MNIRPRHAIALALTLLASLLAPTCAAQTLNIRHLDAAQGLECTYITCLAQDKSGCLWAGTDWGLFMLDGRRFVPYTTDNSNISGNGINTLYYDESTDQLWIGAKSGLSVLDCRTKRINKVIDPRLFNIFDIEPGYTKGEVWVANVNHFIFKLKAGEWVANPDSVTVTMAGKTVLEVSGNTIKGLRCGNNNLLEIEKNRLLVATSDGGLKDIDLERKTFKSYTHDAGDPASIPSDIVNDICKDSHGRIWVGTSRGLALYRDKGRFVRFAADPLRDNSLAGNDVRRIMDGGDGRLWMACAMGGTCVLDISDLAFQNPQTLAFRRINAGQGARQPLSSMPTALLRDSYGNVWIGNWGTGLDMVSHRMQRFSDIGGLDRDNAADTSVEAVCTDTHGGTWLVCDRRLYRIENHRAQLKADLTDKMGGGHNFAKSLGTLGDRRICVGTRNGRIIVNDPVGGNCEVVPSDKLKAEIKSLYRDTDGSTIVCSESGLFRLTESLELTQIIIDGKYLANSVAVEHDRQGRLWVATYGSGVYVFDTSKNKLVKTYDTRETLRSKAITSLLRDKKGGMWIATREGITYVPDTRQLATVINYRLNDGLPGAYVKALVEDRDGDIWATTNKGLARYDRARKTFTACGMADVCLNDRAIALASNGDIVLGALGRALAFNPARIGEQETFPAVTVNSVALLRQSGDGRFTDSLLVADGARPLSLACDENSIRVTFSLNDYALDGDVEYSYRIDGLASDWVTIGDESSITLRNLPAGNYVLRIRARVNSQQWDTKGEARVAFKVRLPFYQSWPMLTLYALLAAALLYLWLRFYRRKTFLEGSLQIEKERMRNAKELTDERMRFFTNITHELRTPLTLIIGPLEDLAADKSLDERLRGKVATISRSACRLLSLVNQIMEFRKTETQNRKLTVAQSSLSDMVRELGLRLRELNKNDEVEIVVDVEPGITICYDSDMLTSILTNLLSNAMKYTDRGSITLSLHRRGDDVTVCVADTGYGISKKALPHIFDRYYQASGKHQASGTGIGLALVKSLATLHHATLSVESEENVGSKFSLTLSATATYPEAIHRQSAGADTSKGVSLDIGEAEETKEREQTLILVVEDNAEIRDYIASSLTETNASDGTRPVRVLTAANGREGLEMANTDIPDIIVSDIMMPEMDGIELCKAIKGSVDTCHIPVILLTAKDTIGDKEEGYQSGADSYLTKPFSAKLLRSRIDNILQNRSVMAAALMREIMGRQAPASSVPSPASSAPSSASMSPSSSSSTSLSSASTAPSTATAAPSSSATLPVEAAPGSGATTAAGAGEVIAEPQGGDRQKAADYEPSTVLESLKSPLDRKFMEKLNDILERNLSNESLDIAFFTDKMAMSHSTFYRKVKSLTGYSANEYVRKYRLYRSRAMLAAGEMRITEVAYACGFSSLSYFRSCFKTEYGVSPSEFVKGAD